MERWTGKIRFLKDDEKPGENNILMMTKSIKCETCGEVILYRQCSAVNGGGGGSDSFSIIAICGCYVKPKVSLRNLSLAEKQILADSVDIVE